MVKMITFLKRREGTTFQEFSRHWHDVHAPIVVKSAPWIRKYVQNHAVQLPSKGQPQFDGVAENWFDDVASWRKFLELYASEAGKSIRDDEKKFLDMSKAVVVLAEEKFIKP